MNGHDGKKCTKYIKTKEIKQILITSGCCKKQLQLQKNQVILITKNDSHSFQLTILHNCNFSSKT